MLFDTRPPLIRLLMDGYVIVPAAVPFSRPNVRADMKGCEGEVEGWIRPGTKKGRLTLGKDRVRDELTGYGEQVIADVLEYTSFVHGLSVEGMSFRGPGRLYALRNTGETTLEKSGQKVHTDYEHKLVEHLLDTMWYPRSAIWGPCAPFELHVGAPSAPKETVHVPRGYVIFFSAGFWHGGGLRLSLEPRFHGFEMPDCVDVPQYVYT